MIGKLSTDELKENVLNVIKKRRSEVVNGAKIGEDCAFLKLDDIVLVTTDPITGACENIGAIAIYISSNDIAACGGEPLAAFFTLIAPPDTKKCEIKKIMQDAEAVAKKLNIEICGGHTEYSDAVNRIIVSVTMIGIPLIKAKPIESLTIKSGDSIIISGLVGSEYTAIKAFDDEKTLKTFLSKDELEEAKSYIDKLSVLEVAKICVNNGAVAMHDITEGGVEGSLLEVLSGAGFNVELNKDCINVSSITKKICDYYGDDVFKIISSGNMIIFTDNPNKIVSALREKNIECSLVGKVTERKTTNCFLDLSKIHYV